MTVAVDTLRKELAALTARRDSALAEVGNLASMQTKKQAEADGTAASIGALEAAIVSLGGVL